ncbi:MAG: histidine ammonia-lyase [Clostridiales bacterium]|jgi:histidine ammonia-lyase|nr:histidine ammonia-lyase [Clostridiales bacterium]
MIKISDKDLTIDELVQVARGYVPVMLCDDIKEGILRSREVVDSMVNERQVVYGITTGFGSLAKTVIEPEAVQELQRNLIVSHACGVGDALPEDVVRAMILLRAKSLAWGHSGVRLVLIERLLDLLNKRVTPIVPEKGSLGASGDLCPLSHMVLPLIGEGEAIYEGERLNGALAMRLAGIETITLEAKEGLALNNGTQCMTAVGALAVYDAWNLLETAEKAAALTLEALNGRVDALDERIHALRRHSGQRISAALILEYTKGSTFINNSKPSRDGDFRIQDAYALRCVPQVHGASRDSLTHITQIVEQEMNSVTDNPLIVGNEAISGGNFHGQPVALVMDFLGIALAELANISERRLERLLNDNLSNGMPSYLIAEKEKKGLHSGFMIVQYTAASLVSENKVLAHPACVDSIPSSNSQEDHVSMGTIAARKAAQILENVMQVIAMELLVAAQAVDLRRKRGEWSNPESEKPKWFGPERPTDLGQTTEKVYNKIRTKVAPLQKDRILAPDIAAVAELIRAEVF